VTNPALSALLASQANAGTPPPASPTSPFFLFGVAPPPYSVTQGFTPIRDTSPQLDSGGGGASYYGTESPSPSQPPVSPNMLQYLSIIPALSDSNMEDLVTRIAAMTPPESASVVPALESALPGDTDAVPAAGEALPPVTDPAPSNLPNPIPSDGQPGKAPPSTLEVGAIELLWLGATWWPQFVEERAAQSADEETTAAQPETTPE
jgi:hypothetical protein